MSQPSVPLQRPDDSPTMLILANVFFKELGKWPLTLKAFSILGEVVTATGMPLTLTLTELGWVLGEAINEKADDGGISELTAGVKWLNLGLAHAPPPPLPPMLGT